MRGLERENFEKLAQFDAASSGQYGPKATETIMKQNGFVVMTGAANPMLAMAIGSALEHTIHEPTARFADGEIRAQIAENMRRRDVFIVQSTGKSDEGSPNDHLMELLLLADAAQRASAGEVTAVMPYYGYARQDRKGKPREPISAAAIASLLERVGVRRIVTVDLHSDQTQGSVNFPWDNLHAAPVLMHALPRDFISDGIVVACPDLGSLKRNKQQFADRLPGSSLTVVGKHRDLNQKDTTTTMFSVGDVEGKNVLLADDLISTAGTMTDAAKLLKERGAERIIAVATHGVFSGPALERIANSMIEQVIVTDTLDQPFDVRNHPRIKVVSVAPLLAEAIRRIHTGDSLSELLQNPPVNFPQARMV